MNDTRGEGKLSRQELASLDFVQDRPVPPLVGDLISISRAPAVVSLSQIQAIRNAQALDEESASLLRDYYLRESGAKIAFEAIIRSLSRQEERGDAFLVRGVYGTGKSHLLAALTLLCARPEFAWPIFLETHPVYEGIAQSSSKRRFVVAISLDEYTAATHLLEYIVLSQIEEELAAQFQIQVALTDQSYLLGLVDQYVAPQVGEQLDETVQAATSIDWRSLRVNDPSQAARVALEFLNKTGFPLDWRRSRAEAWGALRQTLAEHDLDGLVVLLDELGVFLAAKDRQNLNADASFLQYLGQRNANERCWLVAVTQRGLEESGDIDRRTLRQLRDRFRSEFTLDLAELGWIVEHKLVRKLNPGTYRDEIAHLYERYRGDSEPLHFSTEELTCAYPLNPLCLQVIQQAAEASLSRTRSVVQLLQEAAHSQGWLEKSADRLITPDLAFDLLRDEMALSVEGARSLHAFEIAQMNASRIAPGREQMLEAVMKTLVMLRLAEMRWSVEEIRSALVGCDQPKLWQDAEFVRDILKALYRRGAYVERARKEGADADEYYLDIASDAPERIRNRLSELVGEMACDDSRVAATALQACSDDAFPLAGLAEPRSLGIEWWRARRSVTAICRDLSQLTVSELENLMGILASPETKEDGCLFLALPTIDFQKQRDGWDSATSQIAGRFAATLVAWLPRELSAAERDHLIEHTALARMVADPTAFRRRDKELRTRLRERFADSEAEVRRLLHQAYYEGTILTAAGSQAPGELQTERLWPLSGKWEETLTALFAPLFQSLFPRFPMIAPERKLAGRAQTNQIIDQYIRPGQVTLPPASALEAYLLTYAAPLGLVKGSDRSYQLALANRELVAAGASVAPARARERAVDSIEVIRFSEFVGRLAKSEWGLTREQSELLAAALIRTGYLVALDAFLQPIRLDAIAAPLGDNLPYLMRGLALQGANARAAQQLWEAVSNATTDTWDLPTQEQAWSEVITWAQRVRSNQEALKVSIAQTAQSLGGQESEWSWAVKALARANAIAAGVNASLTSAAGFIELNNKVKQLAGGLDESLRELMAWRNWEGFLREQAHALITNYQLIKDVRVHCPEGSLLAKERQSILSHFDQTQSLVATSAQLKATMERWLESYRKHYLAWHQRVHAEAKFKELISLYRSSLLQAAQRLTAAGLGDEDLSSIISDLERALTLRCLIPDPLPTGCVVCPGCGVPLGQDLALPDVAVITERAKQAYERQLHQLQAYSEMLKRRLDGCNNELITGTISKLLTDVTALSPTNLMEALCEEVVVWLRAQLGQPKATRREWGKLEAELKGKEMTKREVVRKVEEWLDGNGDEVVEVV